MTDGKSYRVGPKYSRARATAGAGTERRSPGQAAPLRTVDIIAHKVNTSSAPAPGLQSAPHFSNPRWGLALPPVWLFIYPFRKRIGSADPSSFPVWLSSYGPLASHTRPILRLSFCIFICAFCSNFHLFMPLLRVICSYFSPFAGDCLFTSIPLRSTIPSEIALWGGFRGFFFVLPYFAPYFDGGW